MKLYDSATHAVREFKPLNTGKVGLYLCGPTVQGAPHLGHLRAALDFDVLVRWLRRSGLEVTYVRNVTDIDDKILKKSRELGLPWWALAAHFEREFDWAYRALNTVPPDVTPHATGHIPQQIALVQRLLDRGHAYADTAGNVYFAVKSLPDYGSLTNQRVADLATTEDAAQIDAATESGKRDPRDFALWKAAKPEEPADAAWDAPWGRGRPGWHLECSAMSQAYLGDTFDIHGGGLDLRFPHHENEQAQSHGAGWGFARLWMHNAWLTLKGEKMSKSVGNVVGVRRLLGKWPAPVVRLAVIATHYRTNLEFSEDTLVQAAGLWDKFAGFVSAVQSAAGCAGMSNSRGAIPDNAVNSSKPLMNPGEPDPVPPASAPLTDKYGDENPDLARQSELADVTLPEDFVAALDDDLNVPGALPALHRAVKTGHSALASGDIAAAAAQALQLRAMLDVLGLDPADSAWGASDSGASAGAGSKNRKDPSADCLKSLVAALLEQRGAAKQSRDWARADALRDLLEASGLQITDTPTGATYRVKSIADT
ncbi:Cysteine--tRNA ligase [Mobiluncus mulieris]|uniref:cysteine--tRNA ligase n=1 Tax=Mobiluncus mulieris TaxID=2052 RepID=UPI00019F9546|nr:cysteine--tRNA ligase [Mobiluncus mulieris]EEJ52888.1 cysteine--tRNA ligase [Mobiluncus mulieris ATCC 35243]SPX70240.1 Cysteine--tRNA ligase [Mobiluncus mulieris]